MIRRLIIHLAETDREVKDCQTRYGATPVAHLHRLGLLSHRLLADHAVVLSEADPELLAASGAGVAHCPESNMKLASGIAPVADLLRRGVPVGLGTDGCASNNNLDLIQEMDTAAKLQKVRYLDPTVLPAHRRPGSGHPGRRPGSGSGRRVGALGPGMKADLVVLDLDQPHLTPLYDPYSHLVYAAGGGDVQTVVVNGRVVVQDRRLLTFDLEETLARARELARALGAGPARSRRFSVVCFLLKSKASQRRFSQRQKTENRKQETGLICRRRPQLRATRKTPRQMTRMPAMRVRVTASPMSTRARMAVKT